MNENLQKFLEYASKNEEVKRELDALKDKDDRDAVISSAIEIAKKAGFELSAEDFADKSGELSDDELDAVAGGKNCICVVGGGGTGSDEYCNKYGIIFNNKTCACVGGGVGVTSRTNVSGGIVGLDDIYRCECVFGGSGHDE